MGISSEHRELPNGGHVSLWEYYRVPEGTLEPSFDHYEVEVEAIPHVTLRLALDDARALAAALTYILVCAGNPTERR